MRFLRCVNKPSRKLGRKPVRSVWWISLVSLLFTLTVTTLFHDTPSVSAQGTPPSSTISTGSGPVSWDFGPVGGGTVINVGIQDICPPGICDDHDLTAVLPTPAATATKPVRLNQPSNTRRPARV